MQLINLYSSLHYPQVTKILLTGSAPSVRATGVQFRASSNTGSTFTASARREVILAAGAINSPALLQLSGIGDPSVLTPLGIDVKVNLRTVGRNLQEQSLTSVGHPATSSYNPGGRGPGDVIAYPNLDQLFSATAGSNGTNEGSAAAIKNWVTGSVAEWARKEAINGGSESALATIFGIQANMVTTGNSPLVEIFFSAGYPEYVLEFTFWCRSY